VESRFECRQGLKDNLELELRNFQREKERVRAVIGALGGVPSNYSRPVSALFLIAVAIAAIVSVFSGEETQLWTVELTVLVLSVKIVYMIHCRMRISHFAFWMLSSLEWRTMEVSRQIKELKKTDPTRCRQKDMTYSQPPA